MSKTDRNGQLRVVFVQVYLPHYRVPFCEGLRAWLGERGIAFDVVYGDSDPLKPGRQDGGRLSWAKVIRNYEWSTVFGRFLWQGALGYVRGADLVIVTQENRLLLNYVLMFERFVGKRVFAYWGHGRNFQATVSRPERVRRWVSKHVDWWFAYTDLSRRAIEAVGVPGARVTVVNNSHDTAGFVADLESITASEVSELKSALGIRTENVAVFCSSLHEGKRIDWLIGAADIIRSFCSDFQLVIVGEGNQRPMLERAATSRPWLHLVGARFGREKALHLRLGRVFLMPYFVGLSILDAFCAGLPVVALRDGQHSPEIAYLRDGENGVLTGPSPGEYARCVAEMLADPVRLAKLSEESRHSADHYSLEAMVERFGRGILSCLAGNFPDRVSSTAWNEINRRPTTLGHLRTRVIHPALAPYRVDLFNRVAESTKLNLLFLNRELRYHPDLDQSALRARLSQPVHYLDQHLNVLKRDIPYGLFRLLLAGRQDVAVTTEFSLPTVFAIIARVFADRPFGLVIWSDENLATLAEHGRCRRFLRRWCARRVDGLLMCTPAVADAFAKEFNVDRRRIHLCAVHQSEEAIRASRNRSRETTGTLLTKHRLRDRKVVLYVGRLAEVKNLPVALRAFHAAYDGDPSVTWVFVGSGCEREELESLAAQLELEDRVIFTGHQEGEALYAWYRLASMLVLPSTYEPYGAVVNEALACGVPAMVSTLAGAASLIEPGRNGLLMQPDQASIEAAFRQASIWLEKAETLQDADRPDLMFTHRFSESIEGFLDAVWFAANIAQTGRR